MGLVNRAPPLGGIVASVAVLAAIACGYPGIEGDGPLTGAARSGDAGRTGDAGGSTSDTGTPPPPPPPPPSDSGPGVDGGTSTVLCAVSDLVLCFPFEGNIVDRSPNAIVPTVAQAAGFIAGKQGLSASLDTQSAIRFAPNAAFEIANGTIEAFVKRAVGGTEPSGVIFDDDERFSLTIELDGSVLCKSSGGSARGGAVAVDVWTHVACACDGATLRVYVDGVERASGGGSIGSSPNAAAAVGGNSPSGEPFVGAIDSFRVFRVARTPAQIAAAAAGM